MDKDVTSPTETVREVLRESRDPRVARTRQAVIDAVHQLVEDGVRPISVSDIVRTAGIGRSSFYTHFASLDRLAEFIFVDEVRAITMPDPSAVPSDEWAATWRSFYAQLVGHYAQNRALYSSVLALPLSHDVHLTAVDLVAASLRKWIDQLGDIPADVHPRAAATYLGSGIIGLMDQWMRDERLGTALQLTDTLMALSPGWLIGLTQSPARP